MDVTQDEIALSLARILAAANRRARELGVDASHSLISITQRSEAGASLWRVNYGPEDYVGRRGGDLIIDITGDGTIQRVLHGQ